MKKRTHQAISNIYMGDDGSKLEWLDSVEEWVLFTFINLVIVDKRKTLRLTTSDNRVYISEPSGLFVELVKFGIECPYHSYASAGDLCCSQGCNDNHQTDTDNQVVFCKACQGE